MSIKYINDNQNQKNKKHFPSLSFKLINNVISK